MRISSSSPLAIYRRLLLSNPFLALQQQQQQRQQQLRCSPSPCFAQKRFSRSGSRFSSVAMAAIAKPRAVLRKLLAESQEEGQGATVRRSIGRPELRSLDPFLLLDEFEVSPPAGFPDHPHRGFETVTYMLEVTQVTHLCCNSDWFVVHAHQVFTELLLWGCRARSLIKILPGTRAQSGPEMCRIEPKYQELQSKDISRAEKDGVEVRIIAGEAFGVRSPVYTRTPTMYMDFTVNPGAQLQQPIPENWNSFVYIIEGEGIFGSEDSPLVTSHHCLVLGPGDGLNVWNKSGRPLRFVLVGGQPLDEPVVQHGPFVMNTRAEIQQAMEDYYLGRNGFEKAKQWKSDPLTH